MRAYLIAAVLVTVLGGFAAARTFTSADGRKLEAELVKIEGEDVIIKRTPDGQLFRLAIGKLSAEDQLFVRQSAGSPSGSSAQAPPVAGQAMTASVTPAEDKIARVWNETKPPVSWQVTDTGWLHLRLPKMRDAVSAELLAKHNGAAAADSLKAGLKSAIEGFINQKPGDAPLPLIPPALFAWSADERSIEFGMPVEKKSSKTWPADTGPVAMEAAGFHTLYSWRPGGRQGFASDRGS